MSFMYTLKSFYFHSKFYTYFSFLQLVMIISLMLYVLRDFRLHLKKNHVLLFELIIGILMFVDVFMYSVITNFKITKMFVVEWFVIFTFIGCYIYILLKGVNELDEDIELSLMILRLALQFMRLGMAVI